jgi:hypothetical protein
MIERTWDDFLAFLYELPSTLNPGRQRIRVVRDSLQALVEEKVLPTFTDEDHSRLFPLGFSPSESDLKIVAGVGLERSLIDPAEYEQALRADKAAGPYGFLQTMSGKTFGETVAPLIARFWLTDEGDQFIKMKNTALYDFGLTLHETDQLSRIELKASSEAFPRFQQIRHPLMTDLTAAVFEYDVLLCLGLSNEGLEWWVFTAADVAQLIEDKVFVPQHGGRKTQSGTFWVHMDAKNRARFADFRTTSESLRAYIRNLDAESRSESP